MIEKTCLLCEKLFHTKFENQRKCAECSDKWKNNQESQITILREVIDQWICRIQLPEERFSEFSTKSHGDFPCLRAIFKGKDGREVSWQGRMDVFISPKSGKGEKLYFPSVGRVRLMEVTKQKGNISKMEGKQDIKFSNTYQYLAIDPMQDVPANEIDGNLVYMTARSKYTIKGFGRQYKSEIDTSQSIWAFNMSCECRSGRVKVDSCIAIVNRFRPLVISFSEDGRTEEKEITGTPEDQK